MAMHWLLDNLNHIASVLPAFDTDARVIIQEAMNALTACSMPLYPQDDSQDGGPGFEVRQGDLEVAWQAAQRRYAILAPRSTCGDGSTARRTPAEIARVRNDIALSNLRRRTMAPGWILGIDRRQAIEDPP